ncbi:MAG: response regulator, partial [Chitinophagia bacterium]|nr:response regulator [Chitinophagia bacterium]
MTKEQIFKHRLARYYRSFRAKVLMSFFAFAGIILLWVVAYFAVQKKQSGMQQLEARLTNVQNHFLQNHRNLETFTLSGYRDAAFYATGAQSNIDKFIDEQHRESEQLEYLKEEALNRRVPIAANLDELIHLNKTLLDSVLLLKSIYLQKGFKYYGLEGAIWKNAHVLEDSCNIKSLELLQMRRREKDYMLRGDSSYIAEVNGIATALLLQYPVSSRAHVALRDYKRGFNELVALNQRLGINAGSGLYTHVQQQVDAIGNQFALARAVTNIEQASTYEVSHNVLLGVSLILIIAAILLSYYRSNFLTRDIRQLNKRIAAFISSNFGAGEPEHYATVHSGITEIDQLNKSYALLQRTLRNALNDLENAVQEEKKASEYKSQFVANISHEIRTPLTGITGMVHLLKGTQLNAEQQETVDTLDFSANHLRDLINLVLDYSKMEAGKMELEQIAVDLKGDLTKTLKLFEFKAQEKGLTLRLNYLADATHYVYTDPLRLNQIFFNLLNNAVKFTNAGGIEVRVTQLAANEQEQTLRFEVEDTGIGIDQAEIGKLFIAFNQANKTISRHFGGTGLGLSITSKLVTMMGSHLNVQSQRHKGSVFSFDVTFRRGGFIRNRRKDVVQAHIPEVHLNILLAEDNIINQKVVTRMLQKHNVNITIANNGLEAVELFHQHDFDLIFMDIQMPEMDGFEATQHIVTSERYLLYHTPIVAFSANAYSSDRKQATEAGMDDFLSKPIKPEELDGIIAKYSVNKA